MNADWPLVDPKDDGIRPAGEADECFYCRQRVGQPHGRECVMVQKRVEMEVSIDWNGAKHDGKVMFGTTKGLWQFDDPHYWDTEASEFHKNGSSWCANNFVDALDEPSDVTTLDEETKTILRALVARSDEDQERLRAGDYDGEFDGCLCGILSFKFVRVVDGTPRRATK